MGAWKHLGLVFGAAWLVHLQTRPSAESGPPTLAYATYAVEPADLGWFLADHPDAMTAARAVEWLRERGYAPGATEFVRKRLARLQDASPESVVYCADFRPVAESDE